MRWFSRSEFACKCGCGLNTIDYEVVEVVEDVREHFGKPVTINSACRCETHNAAVGGADSSQHKLCRACDIVVQDISPAEVQQYLLEKYPNSLGIGVYNTFTHVDSRNSMARW